MASMIASSFFSKSLADIASIWLSLNVALRPVGAAEREVLPTACAADFLFGDLRLPVSALCRSMARDAGLASVFFFYNAS